MLRRIFIGLALCGVAVSINAASSNLKQIKADLEKNYPGSKVESVEETPISGLYQIVVAGQTIYTSADGRFHVKGEIIDTKTGKNLTKLSLIEQINDKNSIVFSPKKTKYTINVFTDITCGYCRKLHQEVAALNEQGVKVRYLLYPRAGANSQAHQLLKNVWCAKDQQTAMTEAKNGKNLPEKSCEDPVEDHRRLGNAFGLRGTPMIVTNNGNVIGGYLTAPQLLDRLQSGS